jgi:hypothetical protein
LDLNQKNQKRDTGTNFIRAVQKTERSVNGVVPMQYLALHTLHLLISSQSTSGKIVTDDQIFIAGASFLIESLFLKTTKIQIWLTCLSHYIRVKIRAK